MTRIMLVSRDATSLKGLADGLEKRGGIELIQFDSKARVLEKVEEVQIDVVVADSKLADGDGLELITELTKRFPLINCAMVSLLSPEDFHEYTEGLGVFMQLPPLPGEEEAQKMVEILDSINVLLKA